MSENIERFIELQKQYNERFPEDKRYFKPEEVDVDAGIDAFEEALETGEPIK